MSRHPPAARAFDPVNKNGAQTQAPVIVRLVILWNTLYINAALDQLAGEGNPIRPEDVARLCSLVFEHIDLSGRYAFSVPDSVVRGQLRPLRNPAET